VVLIGEGVVEEEVADVEVEAEAEVEAREGIYIKGLIPRTNGDSYRLNTKRES
jgi:hypothetical protein